MVLGLVVRDGQAVRTHLIAAGEHATEALRLLTDGEDPDEELAAARDEVDAATDIVDGALWRLGARVPVVGRSMAIARDAVQLADAAVVVGDQAAAQADVLFDDGLAVSAEDGRVDLSPLEDARAALAAVDVADLQRARDRLAARSLGFVPASIRSGTRDVLAQADRALGLYEDAQQLVELIPRLLGADQPRRYLVAVQTSAELRGTGGLIGFVTVLTVEDGRFELAPPLVHEALGTDDQGERFVVPGFGSSHEPVPTDTDFEARYGHVAASRLLSNVNVDPDGPTTSRLLLDLYTTRTGNELDGVLLIDPVALEDLLRAIGDVPIPEEARTHPDIPAVIPAGDVTEWATWRVYEVVGDGHTEAREAFLTGFGLSMFERVFSGTWDGVAVAQAIALAANERHIQVFATDERDQGAIEQLGVGGALAADHPDGLAAPVRPSIDRRARPDLLAVVANNAVGGKMDVHLGHAFTATVQLRETPAGWMRDLDLRVEVDNPLPASGMDTYIIGNCLVTEARNQCFQGPPGVNRTWWTVWSGARTVVNDFAGADGEVGRFGSGLLHGLRAIDHHLETPPRSTAGFDLSLTTPAELFDNHGLVHQLVLWRQAKAIPDHWELTIRPPDGHSIDVEVSGGGRGTGMGADPGGEPLRARRQLDGSWRVTGHATADVNVLVRLD